MVQGLGLRVQGSGLRDQGLGCRAFGRLEAGCLKLGAALVTRSNEVDALPPEI